MILGFVIVPLVSLFTKKPDQSLTDGLFASFTGISKAVESAEEPYLKGGERPDTTEISPEEKTE